MNAFIGRFTCSGDSLGLLRPVDAKFMTVKLDGEGREWRSGLEGVSERERGEEKRREEKRKKRRCIVRCALL